jgi:UDP-glucose 4-epimerase
MRIVVVGATGNVGTSVLDALRADAQVESIVGVARRRPQIELDKVTWAEADIRSEDLVALFRGANAVVHLAWLIQPSRDLTVLRSVNVDGSRRVFEAVTEAGVPALVYASSVGAYSPGPKERRVDESWPTKGIATSFYSRHKAEVERLLDRFEREHPEVRCVRLRPGLIMKRESASQQRRYFAGPFLPGRLVRGSIVPVVPNVERLAVQLVHTGDVAEAYRLAAVGDARGPFNVAAEPVLDAPALARILGARLMPFPQAALRAATHAAWRLHLQPTPAGWLDMALAVPILDWSRARRELGWEPRRSGEDALREVMAGMREGAGYDTPPLAAKAGGPGRVRELLTGVGGRGGAD